MKRAGNCVRMKHYFDFTFASFAFKSIHLSVGWKVQRRAKKSTDRVHAILNFPNSIPCGASRREMIHPCNPTRITRHANDSAQRNHHSKSSFQFHLRRVSHNDINIYIRERIRRLRIFLWQYRRTLHCTNLLRLVYFSSIQFQCFLSRNGQ